LRFPSYFKAKPFALKRRQFFKFLQKFSFEISIFQSQENKVISFQKSQILIDENNYF